MRRGECAVMLGWVRIEERLEMKRGRGTCCVSVGEVFCVRGVVLVGCLGVRKGESWGGEGRERRK